MGSSDPSVVVATNTRSISRLRATRVIIRSNILCPEISRNTLPGSRLELNLNTGAGGVAKVEILHESGEPIRGFSMAEADELNGNSVRFVATWNNGNSDVRQLAGKPVRLRIKMRAAKLFAFQFL